MKPVKGWWFAAEAKLPHGDNRPVIIGEAHTCEGELILCEHGLHSSKRILDALKYATGSLIYRVESSVEIIHGDDKMVARIRKYLAGGIDISDILHSFARKCALDVIHLWDAPDIVIRYLKTGDPTIQAAASASSDAAWASSAAASDAAWASSAAARASSVDAASDAVWASSAAAWVSSDAVWAAADAASASSAAAKTKQNNRLTAMTVHALEKANSNRETR